MDPMRKREGSMEGRGLSVSLHPISWMRIHVPGSEGFILEGDGRFLDALSLTEEEREAVWNFGVRSGMLARVTAYSVAYYDEELGETVEFMMPTRGKAEAKAEDLPDARIVEVDTTEATSLLADLSGHAPERRGIDRIPPDFQFDLVLLQWCATKRPDLDGIWWREAHDPDRHSAPRGVILPTRLPLWKARPAGLEDLREFQFLVGTPAPAFGA